MLGAGTCEEDGIGPGSGTGSYKEPRRQKRTGSACTELAPATNR